MVVWLKPCESRSSPGFTPKTPLLTQRGFSLAAGKYTCRNAPVDPRHAWSAADPGWRLPMMIRALYRVVAVVDPRHAWMCDVGLRNAQAVVAGQRPALPMDRCRRARPIKRALPVIHHAEHIKKTAPQGRRLQSIRLHVPIRRPKRPHALPAGETPRPPRSAFPPVTAVHARQRWLPPPVQRSAVWPDPSAPRSG